MILEKIPQELLGKHEFSLEKHDNVRKKTNLNFFGIRGKEG